MKHYKPFTDVIYGIVECARVFVDDRYFYPSLTYESMGEDIRCCSTTKLFTAVIYGIVA
jgi:hypothetical protein